MNRLADKQPASTGLAPASSTDGAVGKSILVVDDEQNFVTLLQIVFTKRGYKVQTALSGEEALQLLHNSSFELAVVDIRMGLMDGLSLVEELKRRLPGIKFIMMTAYPTLDTRIAAAQKGASGYFTKPVDLQKLLDTVRGLL
jgi:DNA-binding NtrC family response regulator